MPNVMVIRSYFTSADCAPKKEVVRRSGASCLSRFLNDCLHTYPMVSRFVNARKTWNLQVFNV